MKAHCYAATSTSHPLHLRSFILCKREPGTQAACQDSKLMLEQSPDRIVRYRHRHKSEMGCPDPSSPPTSLTSLPNELLLELLSGHSSTLHLERQEKGLTMEWFTWNAHSTSKYTVPWLEEHHPIAMPLSQTCTRLRALMIPRIWEEVGISTLEELAKSRDGLRLFPERGELVLRLEWSWLLKHPAYDDWEYRSQHRVFNRTDPCYEPLERLLKPPFRWHKQPLATKEECVGALTEVVCRLPNLDTLLWVSPYLPMQAVIVDFLASKTVPLTSFQVDIGGVALTTLKPEPAPYWRFAGRLLRLSLSFEAVNRASWEESDMARWQAYDDDLTGLEAFCEESFARQLQKAKEAGEPKLSAAEREQEHFFTIADERESAMAYKIITAACQGGLRSLTLDPHWVLRTPTLAPHWVQLEKFHLIRERRDPFDPVRFSRLKDQASMGIEAFQGDGEASWYKEDAHWHSGAAAIRPAIYHAARHRVEAGLLTAADIQALADKPPEYPLSLFYPCFRDASVAQGMAETWESLVEQGESERVVCRCAECQGE